MLDEYDLVVRQAAMQSDLEAIYARLARMPTRAELARAALGIIFCTMMITTLLERWLAH